MLPSLGLLPIGAGAGAGAGAGHSTSQRVMDASDTWRQRVLGEVQDDDNVPESWEAHADLVDGALVNVYASTLGLDERSVQVEDVQEIVHDATGHGTTDLAQLVNAISKTDGGHTLGWWAFGRRLKQLVPSVQTMWVIGGLYSFYLLAEQFKAGPEPEPAPWWEAAGDSRNPYAFAGAYKGEQVSRARQHARTRQPKM